MTNLRDVAEEKGAEKAGEDFLEALRKLAHKLSQPLTSLCGSVEVALMGELNESECRQVLELALRESRRMSEALETLRDLLELEGSSEGAQPVCWTQRVEKSLQEAASTPENRHVQLVSNLKDEVWVRANPEQLDMAVRNLIGRAIGKGSGKQVVRVGLSVRCETACLSISDVSVLPDAKPAPARDGTYLSAQSMESQDLDWWIIRRAIERQGGTLEIKDVSQNCRCYQLSLPVVKVVRQS